MKAKTFKQWLRTKDARQFQHSIDFDRDVVKAMEAAWNAALEQECKRAEEDWENHADWCSTKYACNCGAEK
jgi:hypothetical protein